MTFFVAYTDGGELHEIDDAKDSPPGYEDEDLSFFAQYDEDVAEDGNEDFVHSDDHDGHATEDGNFVHSDDHDGDVTEDGNEDFVRYHKDRFQDATEDGNEDFVPYHGDRIRDALEDGNFTRTDAEVMFTCTDAEVMMAASSMFSASATGSSNDHIHAVVDTACSRTLIGLKTLNRLSEEWFSRFGLSIRFSKGEYRFRGVGGKATSHTVALIPVGIRRRLGVLRACVVQGSESAEDLPLLMSKAVLEGLGAVIDVARCHTVLRNLNTSSHLSLNRTGHMLLLLDNFPADVHEWELKGFTQATLKKLPHDQVHVFHSEALDMNLESDSLDGSNLEKDYLAGFVGPDGNLDVSELEWGNDTDLVRNVFENRSAAQTIVSNVRHNAKYHNKNNVNTSRKFTTRHHDRDGEGTITGQEGREDRVQYHRATMETDDSACMAQTIMGIVVKPTEDHQDSRGPSQKGAPQGMREIDPSATPSRRGVQNEFLPKALAKLSKMELTEWAETFGVVGA